jgi:hypothetical protein
MRNPVHDVVVAQSSRARRRGADRIRQLVVLGDGAPWIWKLATAIVPEATPIVDIYPPAKTCMTWPLGSRPSSATATTTGCTPGWPTSTPATSKP